MRYFSGTLFFILMMASNVTSGQSTFYKYDFYWGSKSDLDGNEWKNNLLEYLIENELYTDSVKRIKLQSMGSQEFVVSKSIIRYLNSDDYDLYDDYFEYYNIDSATHHRFYKYDDSDPVHKSMTFPEDINRTGYELIGIEKLTDDTLTINGYKCYKVVVRSKQTHPVTDEIYYWTCEMFVSDEFDHPFMVKFIGIENLFNQSVMVACLAYQDDNYFQFNILAEMSENKDDSLFVVPEIFLKN